MVKWLELVGRADLAWPLRRVKMATVEASRMDIQRQIDYWLSGSQDDIEAAAVLLEKHKVSQCLFFAHLAVEKALKAQVSKTTGAVPPRTHDLLRLAELAGISLEPPRRTFLARLQRYCLEGRYPDLSPETLASGEARSELDEAGETRSWLIEQLT
jgi:HEPN domain-containing protein